MTDKEPQNHWIVWLTFVIAIFLDQFPLPDTLALGRPQFVMIVLIYWVLALPERFSFITAFFIGILMDEMRDNVFGVYALGLIIQAYLVLIVYQRLRMFPAFQQSIMVMGIIFIGMFVTAVINMLLGDFIWDWRFFYPCVFSALFWPWSYLLLRHLRQSFRIQ
ncbi:rod shape-determining protein MreD [Marinicellulosiphila megalodicopiae]|uniref:rod shape-determining protein MreD n=1 Tax=Marinicellulosiphila megalodicopiae TaxID=2724896 RepID=UPI003BB1F7CF